MPGFAALLKANAKELLTLQGDQSDRFLELLGDLRDRLTGRLASMGGKDEPLDVFRLQQVQKETEAQIASLEAKGKGIFGKALEDSTELAVEHLSDELDKLSSTFDAEPLVVSLDASKVLADPHQKLLAEQFQSSVERYGDDLLNGVRRELFFGIRTGTPFNNVVRAIGSENGPLGEIGEANAERLVRTEVSQAYNAAHVAGFKRAKREIPDLAETWIHIGSYKDCPICLQLHGTKRPAVGYWTVTQGSKTRKIIHPPAHPHCVCRLVAMRPEWKHGMEEAGYLSTQEEGEQPTL